MSNPLVLNSPRLTIEIDALIRQFGYRTTPEVLKHLSENRSLMKNLSAAAHLIHGSSEGRFRITYCPGHLTKDEIESVGFEYAPLDEMLHRYDPNTLQDGWNELELTNESGKEKVFYISNPAVGLWAFKDRFELSEVLNKYVTFFSIHCLKNEESHVWCFP